MKNNRITYLVIASGLALAALIAIQVSWMRHSQQLLEEQLNHRVSMALCNTVEELAQQESCAKPLRQCLTEAECARQLDTLIQTELFDQTLSNALQFYNVNLPFQAKVQPQPVWANFGETSLPPFSCSLNPLTQSDSHFINLEFQGKTDFILERMGMMMGASLGILLFICLVFFFATYHLIQQQRMGNLNRAFFNQMAHEFRTPLTNIKLAGNMVQRKASSEEQLPYIQIIRDEVDQMMNQVERVLYVARWEKGDYSLEKEPLFVDQLLQEVVDKMQLQIQEQGAEVRLTSEGEGHLLRGDSLHLGNVFRNLLDNALKYSSAYPLIEMEVHYEAHGVVVDFLDNGPGLTAEQQLAVFQPFHRCKTQATNGSLPKSGFGLGLAYVKRIVDLHQGQIELQSSPGNGTRFTLFLPYDHPLGESLQTMNSTHASN